jgi:hypothetical protein
MDTITAEPRMKLKPSAENARITSIEPGEATCEGLLLEGDGWRGVGGSSRDDDVELRLGTIDQIHPKGDPIHSHRHQIDLRAGRSTR